MPGNVSKIRKNFLAKLGEILPPTSFSLKNVDRFNYSRDSNFKSLIQQWYGKVEHLPDVIVWPESVAQVQALVKLAGQARVPIIPFGAGSGVSMGTQPHLGGMVIDMKRMQRLLKVDEENLLVVVETGMMGLHLEEKLARRGYTLGHFPSSILSASVGGYLAARSAGQTSSRYGKIEDRVLSLEVVTGTGELVETRDIRNMSGIDLNQVFLGSEGTLGIITKATLRIHPQAPKELYSSFQFRSMAQAMEAIRRIMQSGLRPAVVRLYDELDSLLMISKKEKTSKKQDSFFSPLKRDLKYIGAKTLFNIPFGTQILPHVLPNECLLVIVHEGDTPVVYEEQKLCRHFCEQLDAVDLGEGPARYWKKHRYSVSYNASPLFYYGSFTDTIEVATTWDKLLPLYNTMVKTLAPHAMIMAHLSHVYPEGGALYFTFVAPLLGLKRSEKLYDLIWDKAMTVTHKMEGIISHHHGIGRLKAKYMPAEWGEGTRLFSKLKELYDPYAILNPGKLIDA